jgi:hypothetical protein
MLPDPALGSIDCEKAGDEINPASVTAAKNLLMTHFFAISCIDLRDCRRA